MAGKPHLDSDLVPFLRALAKNNNKAWFDTQRDRYQMAYVGPALAFIEALAPPLAKLDPPLTAIPKINGSLRRINRDIRFSKDKRPYNAMLHLIFGVDDRINASPGLHVVVAPDHYGIGAGHWAFAPSELERYRRAVAGSEAKTLAAAIAKAEKAGFPLDPPALARAPKGFTAKEPAATFLRHKGIVVRSHDLPIPDALFGPKAVDFVVAGIKPLLPLLGWLKANVYS